MKKIRSLLFDNLPLKFIALVFAVLLWLYVDAELTSEESLTVKLDIFPPKGLSVSFRDVHEVKIYVKGPKHKIESLTSEKIVAKLKISDKTPVGRNTHKINRSAFDLPLGVSLRSINPDVVTIELAKRVSRDMRVEPNINVPPGYEWTLRSVVPDVVKVEGPESALEANDSIKTELINFKDKLLKGLSDGGKAFTQKVNIATNINGAEITSKQDIMVEVFIFKSVSQETRVISLPVRILTPNRGKEFIIEPAAPTAEIKISGPAQKIKELSPPFAGFSAFVTLFELTETEHYEARVEVKTPVDFRAAVSNPKIIFSIRKIKVNKPADPETIPKKPDIDKPKEPEKKTGTDNEKKPETLPDPNKEEKKNG